MIQSIGSGIKSIKDLFRSSALLFLASAFVNICNLVFWLFMVRRLNAIDYGVLNSLISLFMIVSLPATTFQAVVTRFVSQFKSHDEREKIKCLILYFGKRLLLLASLFLCGFILISKNIALFLQIESQRLIIITGLGLFFAILIPIALGTLQGLQRFAAMAINSVANGAIKLIMGVSLVSAGFKVIGALWGYILASVSTFVIAAAYIPKKIFKATSCRVADLKLSNVYSYFIPVSISLFCYIILTNSDVVLVKHFFSPLLAGKYSVAQMVGKIILFLPGTVGIVLFPKMTEALAKKQRVSRLLLKGLVLAAALCMIASIVCLLYPDFVLRVLTKKACIECIPLVRLFCIAMTFYALVQILIFYYLSIHSLRFVPFLVAVAILQPILISVFHGELSHVLFTLVFCSFILFLAGILRVNWEQ